MNDVPADELTEAIESSIMKEFPEGVILVGWSLAIEIIVTDGRRGVANIQAPTTSTPTAIGLHRFSELDLTQRLLAGEE